MATAATQAPDNVPAAPATVMAPQIPPAAAAAVPVPTPGTASAPAAASSSSSSSTVAPAAPAPAASQSHLPESSTSTSASTSSSSRAPAADPSSSSLPPPASSSSSSSSPSSAPSSASKTTPVSTQQDDAEAEANFASADFTPGDIQGLDPSVIDGDIFAQLLEMDDDEEDHEFSKGIVWNYFDQAEVTFAKMDDALSTSELGELSTLGHFLKGSSAAVGVIKVRDSCECMQHYGKMHDADGISALSESEAVDKLTKTLREVKLQYREAERVLRRFYEES
ncbi:Phosphorelay intermediate protein [Tilletia horrida]|nr:Phosphorelay intermediate protein [Tilletia horrida]KAK0559533.1 Phosphorelay intermediate protein [Tilletia horrida]